MPSLLSKTSSSYQVLDKIQTGIILISGYMVKYLVKFFLIPEPLIILTSLKHYLYVTKEILAGCDVIIIFSNLEQSKSQNPDA